MAVRRRRGALARRAPRGRASVVAAVIALYLGAGALSTWPALRHAADAFMAQGLPGRPGEAAPGDHLQTTWQLWLPGHQLERGEPLWLDPYSFRPEVEPRVNFAAWPFSIVFVPVEAVLGTVRAWNAFVLLGYLGAGALTFLWLRSLGLGVGASLVGGLAFALAPYRVVQGGAGHLLAWVSMLLPLSLWAWERRSYWVAAAALASIPLSGQVHLALAAIPFVVAYALVRRADVRWVAASAAGAIAAGLAVWAFSIRNSIGGSRSFAQVERYSAEVWDFVARDPRHGLESFVFLGWLLPLAALAGLVLYGRTRLGLRLLLGAGALLPCLLALGANVPGYQDVWNVFPGLGTTRVPGRLMPIACLALAALAALAVQRMTEWRRTVIPVAAAVLVALDLLVGVTGYRATPADEANAAYAAIDDAQLGRVLDVPVYAPDRQEASVYLYYAMQAPRERPGGYSTVAPRQAARALERLRPCTDVRDLADLGVRILVIHGRPPCGVPGRLLARAGPVAAYAAYIPPGW